MQYVWFVGVLLSCFVTVSVRSWYQFDKKLYLFEKKKRIQESSCLVTRIRKGEVDSKISTM